MVTLRLLGGMSLSDGSREEVRSLLAHPKQMAVLVYVAVGSETSIAVGERLTEGPRDNHGGAAGTIMRAGERARGGSGTRM